jgi:hypothetical protein
MGGQNLKQKSESGKYLANSTRREVGFGGLEFTDRDLRGKIEEGRRF